jgi:N-methylhydantoinase A
VTASSESPFAGLRFAVDTGGTFTDLVVEGDRRGLRFFKRPTTPDDPVRGLLDVLAAAADDFSVTTQELLGRGDLFIFGTTRATNAVVTRSTARTAFLTTRGHPDILLLREGGGRTTLFDYSQEYPEPYVPRSLTFEVDERILSDATVRTPLDEDGVRRIARQLRAEAVEAVGVCLLWSIVNPVHELRVGEILAEEAPDLPFTLSHQLNPTLREYRRASSTVIDASLKPLMSAFFGRLEERLRVAGFSGRLLIVTSAGGVLDADAVAGTPIHSIGSGPAAGPVAGRYFAGAEADARTALVTDAGGTTYDVSLVRDGRIPWTRETVIGHPVYGYATGFPSVDVRSVGAGGGSIAWVDDGGLLHVGPESAGAMPGPACYGRGGAHATVTDACVVLGYIDPQFFLGGEMTLDVSLAAASLEREVASKLGVDLADAAAAVLDLAIERMVSAIEGITLNQGIDPAKAVMIGGGGGGGLYSVGIARRLGCTRVVIPSVSAALSATGALLSDLRADFAVAGVTSTDGFDHALAKTLLTQLAAAAQGFVSRAGEGATRSSVEYSVEARYPHQVWEIDLPLRQSELAGEREVRELRDDFHDAHEKLFAIRDVDAPVEIVSWRASAHCVFREVDLVGADSPTAVAHVTTSRPAYFSGALLDTPVRQLNSLPIGETIAGPLLVESGTTTVVVDPHATITRTESGSLVIAP